MNHTERGLFIGASGEVSGSSLWGSFLDIRIHGHQSSTRRTKHGTLFPLSISFLSFIKSWVVLAEMKMRHTQSLYEGLHLLFQQTDLLISLVSHDCALHIQTWCLESLQLMGRWLRVRALIEMDSMALLIMRWGSWSWCFSLWWDEKHQTCLFIWLLQDYELNHRQQH